VTFFHEDGFAEHRAVEDRTDLAVGGGPGFLEFVLHHALGVRGDGGAFHAHAVLLDRAGRLGGDAVVGFVALLHAEVVVLQVHVQEGLDELLLDHRPDDPRHLVTVQLDDRCLDLYLSHGVASL